MSRAPCAHAGYRLECGRSQPLRPLVALLLRQPNVELAQQSAGFPADEWVLVIEEAAQRANRLGGGVRESVDGLYARRGVVRPARHVARDARFRARRPTGVAGCMEQRFDRLGGERGRGAGGARVRIGHGPLLRDCRVVGRRAASGGVLVVEGPQDSFARQAECFSDADRVTRVRQPATALDVRECAGRQSHQFAESLQRQPVLFARLPQQLPQSVLFLRHVLTIPPRIFT